MQHFSSLKAYHTYVNWPPPEHPMLSVVSMEEMGACSRPSSPPITTDFYLIKRKRFLEGDVTYGRTKYDFSQGSMLFAAPRQVLQWDGLVADKGGFTIHVHEDYLKGHAINETIGTYGYFNYAVNEALHLSPQEEATINAIFESIRSEYAGNPDAFSKAIILAQLDTMLKYADRFYNRQFIHRKPLISDLSARFRTILQEFFTSGRYGEMGSPNIDWIARRLGVSPRYLTDALKAETGKTAIEHIHLFVMDQAKELLLEPGRTVAEVAYALGFEYPQYFSRLFKKKVGVSPTRFRDAYRLH